MHLRICSNDCNRLSGATFVRINLLLNLKYHHAISDTAIYLESVETFDERPIYARELLCLIPN